MYTGGEFLEEKEKLQEICQCVKAQNHFLRRIVGAGRGGGWGLLQRGNPTQSTGYLVLTQMFALNSKLSCTLLL